MKSNKSLKTSFSRPTLLIDGDLYLYRASISVEKEIDWGDDIWSLYADIGAAKEIFQNQLEKFKEKLGAEDMVVTMSGSSNFRKTVEPTYKWGRKKTRKPVGYVALVEWVADTFNSITVDQLEADDVMGIMGSMPGTNAIIVSDDKDMMTIPGRLYRPMSGEFHITTEAQADAFFLKQVLMGDATDGYSGCPKIGPKTAEKVLGSHPTWNAVVQAYQKENLDETYALTQARLARILRHTDWDDETSEVQLWEPNK